MRNNFTKAQMREMRERSGDVCEAGLHESERLYGMAKGDRCNRRAQEFDHVTADALKRTRIQSIDEGLHVCKLHHDIKTNAHDKRAIAKAKRIDEEAAGIPKRANHRPMPGSRASGWKQKIGGGWEKRR